MKARPLEWQSKELKKSYKTYKKPRTLKLNKIVKNKRDQGLTTN